VLAEVEALCHRVAILRAGRLVEVGTLDAMRLRSSLAVEATFAGAVPDVRNVPGVTGIRVEAGTLHCRVDGSMAPLLAALARAEPLRVVSREPSLEELFLTHYGAGSPQPQAAP
jgi:ABC-2 type transport system ATP-binding protein